MLIRFNNSFVAHQLEFTIEFFPNNYLSVFIVHLHDKLVVEASHNLSLHCKYSIAFRKDHLLLSQKSQHITIGVDVLNLNLLPTSQFHLSSIVRHFGIRADTHCQSKQKKDQYYSRVCLNHWVTNGQRIRLYVYMRQSVLKMKDKADPLLLSLLEKIANPVSQLDFSVTLKGVFAPPQQWKQSDEASPNTFTYVVDIYNNKFSAGKIEPRKLTEKELKELQDAKNKKASKKDAKEEEKPVEEDPQTQRKRLEWEALTQEQRFYRTQQDPYKAFSLLWPDNTQKQELAGDNLKAFEDAVTNGEMEIVLIRKPQGGEEDIAKIKKSKPKGLNLGELYSAHYKGTINLQQLSVPGAVSTTQRVNLSFAGELPPECVRIDSEKCYALIEITLSQPINPLVKEEKPTARQLLGESSTKLEANLLTRLAEEIRKGMRAISQEYSTLFAKEKEHTNEDRRLSSGNTTNLFSVSTLRINQVTKRKDQFLSQFSSSGKYAILRERISKTVKAIVIDRCRKERSGAAISRQQLQKVLSELNLYLRQMAEKTLDEGVTAEANGLHEDLVLGHQYNRAGRKQALAGVAESPEQRETRLAQEYQIVNKIPQAEEKYINLLLIHNNDLTSLQTYARFCLRHAYYDKAYALFRQIAAQSHDFKYQLIISFFQAQRRREHEAIAVLTKLAQGQGSSEDKALVHNLLSFLYERLGEEKKSEKHLALGQKYFQLKSNPHMKINPPKNPYVEPTPRVPKPGKYISQLSQHESQQMRLTLMNYLIEYNFYQLAKDYIPKLGQSTKKSTIEALILVSEQKYEEAISILEQLLEKDNKNLEHLLLKAEICFLSEKLFQCEEVFLYLLKLKPSPAHCYSIYLRLALTYLHRKSWEDAKATFNKAVELRPNSGAGWLGLGIAHLRLSQLEESQEALNLSSIYNPLSSQTASYLKEIQEKVDTINHSNYQYLSGTVN